MAAPDYEIRLNHAFLHKADFSTNDLRTKKQRMQDSRRIIDAIYVRFGNISHFVEIGAHGQIVPNEHKLDCAAGQMELYDTAYRMRVDWSRLDLYYKEGTSTPQRWFEMHEIDNPHVFTMEKDGLEILSIKH